jgi:hypothetical protein
MIWTIILPDIFRLLLDEDNDIKTIRSITLVCRSFYQQYTEQTTIVAHLRALESIYRTIYRKMRAEPCRGGSLYYYRGNWLWLDFVNVHYRFAEFRLYITKQRVPLYRSGKTLCPQDFLDLIHTLLPIFQQLFVPTIRCLRISLGPSNTLLASDLGSEKKCIYKIMGSRIDWGMESVDPWLYSIITQSIDSEYSLHCEYTEFINDCKYQKRVQRIRLG